jgi:hypothetical protein
MLDDLPREVGVLGTALQGVLVHVHWAERMGLSLSEQRKQEVSLRAVARQLGRIRAMDERPLSEVRALERRLVGNCRDFSVLLCAMLRQQGVPARARCGFATYFRPGGFEDHWVCEWWDAAESRWVRVDAQLDPFQRQTLSIGFDPLDMPEGPFMTAGQAWTMCRAARADPQDFGIFDLHGMWFIQGNLVRDFLALNKVEILPWDEWGRMAAPGQEAPPEEAAFLDSLAGWTVDADGEFERLRSIFSEDSQLRLPAGWQP